MRSRNSRTSALGAALAILLSLLLLGGGRGDAASSREAPSDLDGNAIGTVIPASPADSSCDSGKGCVWTEVDFEGSKVVFGTADAGASIILGPYDESAKDEFGNRRMRFFASNGDLLSCINAGNSDRSLPGRTHRLDIVATGITC